MDIRLALGGDVNVRRRNDPTQALRHVGPLWSNADLRIVNLEGLLSRPSAEPARSPDIPHKRGWTHSGPDAVRALTAAGIQAVSCANNVSFPPAAVLESLQVLDRHGIVHAGAGIDRDAAHRVALLPVGPMQVGLLAYSSIVFPYGTPPPMTHRG